MNPLAQALVEGILGENIPPKKKIVGMFGGGFKPPTSGHLEVVKKALQENPEMDALIILVGSGTRDSISQEESLAIWNIYKKSLPNKVVVMASPDNKPPIGAIYSYAKKNPDKEIYWFIGEREGNKDDFYDFIKRTRALRRGNYTNIQAKKITTADSVSGTKARKALLAKDKETFNQFIPNIPEVDEIWDMLTDVVKEYKHKYDKEELRKGIEVEKEHTDDPKIALKIALDHLDEDPQYYTKLATLGLEEQHLQERIAYDAETRMQTRFLMKQFLKTVGTKVEDSTEGTLVGDEYELVYGFYPMKKGLGFMPFKVEGSAGPKDIAIEIKYNPELLDKKLYSELSAELRNSVRHELEHLAQYRAEKGVRPGEDGVDQDDLPDVEYLTLDYEIPGHIQGLRTKAKAKKISLQQAIDDLFNSFEYDLDPEEEDFVRETWMNWLETNMPGVSLTKIKEDFDQQDVEDLDNLADRELNPIDVVLTGNHFFDRLNDPRNRPEIDYLELEDFFTKLGDNREEFINFLNKYKSVVATDTETNINIPFMKMANKAIAKTIMRKRNFQTPDVKVELEETPLTDQDIIGDILGEVNNLQEVDLNKVKEKLKYYGKKGMLTLSILLAVANGLQANPGIAKDIIDTGIEMVDTNSKTDFYNAIIGYAQKVMDSERGSGGNIELIGALKEVKLHYEALRDNKTPILLSKTGQAALNSITKHLSQSNKITDYVTYGATVKTLNEADPKKGTGKKPKGSGRRLYTDEDPSDTVSIKFKTKEDIVDTLNKKSFKAKSHARQSQIINLIHQRVRAAHGKAKDPDTKSRLKRGLDYITKRKEASKKKTQRLKKLKEILTEVIPNDVINSFDIQNNLVPEVWDGEQLKPEIREKLLKIAQDFFESLDLPKGTKLKDIKLTGSLANYNWSKFSDFDLHLVLDFSEIDDDEEFVRNYFMAKKGIWNDAHDITIYDFPVEVYVENEGESHTASGLYSILNDKWIVIPKKQEVMIDKDDISTKAEDYISQTEEVQKLYDEGKYEEVIIKVDKIKERLRNMRSSGLEKGGEYSVENLAFKVLRRSDIIGQLNDLKSNSYDTMMSINENIDVESLNPNIISLTQYMSNNGLNLKPYPKVKFIKNDIKNAEDLLGRTAYYNPNAQLVVLYTMGRHPKDILRSYAHELIHHHQNLSGTLNHSNTTNTNEDGNLDKIEREAYENGNILFRNWEDQIKNEK